MIITGKIEDGKYSGQTIDWKLFEGKRVIIEVKVDRRTRSQRQNAYYWGVVIKYLVDETGYTEDEIHEILKQKFLETKMIRLHNSNYIITGSSAKLNTMEFMDYIKNIRDWASAELNCYIPEPNEEIK